MGVGAGLYMCDVVKQFTFAISSPDEFLFTIGDATQFSVNVMRTCGICTCSIFRLFCDSTPDINAV